MQFLINVYFIPFYPFEISYHVLITLNSKVIIFQQYLAKAYITTFEAFRKCLINKHINIKSTLFYQVFLIVDDNKVQREKTKCKSGLKFII